MTSAMIVPVERTGLVTQDMDRIADLIRAAFCLPHSAVFRCADPAGVRARLCSAAVSGLIAGAVHYGGFECSAEVGPVALPTVVCVTRGAGVVTTAREQLHCTPGDIFMPSAGLASSTATDNAGHISLQVPEAVVGALAEEHTGIPAGHLRFTSMAPVSVQQQHAMAKTAHFIRGQLIACGATGIHPLMAREMSSLAAAAMLAAFPNTAMISGYVRGPQWVSRTALDRAVTFIDEHAGQPVTADQVAEAVQVPSQALRHAFLSSFGITTTGYLRRVRLEHAYQDLLDADPARGQTAAEVARRWGWASQEAFTASYRRRFGVSPARTLQT